MRQTRLLKKLDALIGPLLARILPASHTVNQADLCLTKSSTSTLLFIRPGGIGDAVLLIPVLQAVRDKYPAVELVVLAERRNAGAFALCHKLDEVLCYDDWHHWGRLFKRRYAVVVDTEQSHYLSAVIARFLRAEIRTGFATNKRSRLFHVAVPYSQQEYELDSFARLVSASGISIEPVACRDFVFIPEDVQRACDKLLECLQGVPFVVLFPGASIAERRWQIEKFHTLAQQCNAADCAVVVVGGAEDRGRGEAIVAGLQGVNLAGRTTLMQTAAVLKRAKLLVSGDSGVMHLGTAVGCPTVALFGPGIADKWAPRAPDCHIVNLELKCSPCTQFGTTPPCPYGAACIRDISVDMVWAEAQKLLKL